MNGFWGADTEALRSMGSAKVRRAEVLADLESRLASSIESMEWTGEDAETFRADWAGKVRPGLQDCFVELRQEARRLINHADEQDAVSSPDGPGGIGGSAGPRAFLRDLTSVTDSLLRDLRAGDTPGSLGGRGGELAPLLRELLSTEQGREAFLGSLLGSVFGGLFADMIGRAMLSGLALENLLTGLGAGAGLGDVLGQTPLQETVGAGDGQAASGTAGSEDSAGQGGAGAGESAGSGREASGGSGGSGSGGSEVSGSSSGAGEPTDGSGGSPSGGSSGGSAGGESGGSSGGSGADAGGDAAGDPGPGSEEAADSASATGGRNGMPGQGTAEASSEVGGPSGRIEAEGGEGGESLLERLLAMLDEMLSSGGSGPSTNAAAIGLDIGHD